MISRSSEAFFVIVPHSLHLFSLHEAHKSGVVWIGDRIMKVGGTDVSRGTIYDVPGIIANAKRPLIMVLDAEHNVDWQRMDKLTVAIGMINQIQEESKQDVNSSIKKDEGEEISAKTVIPPSPSAEVRQSVQEYAVKR